jgi:hypothetical protein
MGGTSPRAEGQLRPGALSPPAIAVPAAESCSERGAAREVPLGEMPKTVQLEDI